MICNKTKMNTKELSIYIRKNQNVQVYYASTGKYKIIFIDLQYIYIYIILLAMKNK